MTNIFVIWLLVTSGFIASADSDSDSFSLESGSESSLSDEESSLSDEESIDSDETTTTTTATTTTTPPCPSSFELHNDICYHFNEATRTKTNLLWAAARIECQNLAANADLVAIETVDEFNIIITRLNELYPTRMNVNFWTGAMYDGTNARWVATNAITNLPSSVEPNRVNARSSCGRIFYSNAGAYTHRGLTCTTGNSVRVGYVCEIQP